MIPELSVRSKSMTMAAHPTMPDCRNADASMRSHRHVDYSRARLLR